jgi:hypothetical protein
LSRGTAQQDTLTGLHEKQGTAPFLSPSALAGASATGAPILLPGALPSATLCSGPAASHTQFCEIEMRIVEMTLPAAFVGMYDTMPPSVGFQGPLAPEKQKLLELKEHHCDLSETSASW